MKWVIIQHRTYEMRVVRSRLVMSLPQVLGADIITHYQHTLLIHYQHSHLIHYQHTTTSWSKTLEYNMKTSDPEVDRQSGTGSMKEMGTL